VSRIAVPAAACAGAAKNEFSITAAASTTNAVVVTG
jgi:hypothetical protein